MKKYSLIFIMLISLNTFAVSFDCSKASSFSEKSVCSDKNLSELDDTLSSTYKELLDLNKSMEISSDDNKKEQREWIKKTRTCKDISCIKKSYEFRINELQTEIHMLNKALRYREN